MADGKMLSQISQKTTEKGDKWQMLPLGFVPTFLKKSKKLVSFV
jgi:hypothetical protein